MGGADLRQPYEKLRELFDAGQAEGPKAGKNCNFFPENANFPVPGVDLRQPCEKVREPIWDPVFTTFVLINFGGIAAQTANPPPLPAGREGRGGFGTYALNPIFVASLLQL